MLHYNNKQQAESPKGDWCRVMMIPSTPSKVEPKSHGECTDKSVAQHLFFWLNLLTCL
jgi:hypothetical protein